MTPIRPTPPRLVEEGLAHFGLFQRPFPDENILDCPGGLPAIPGLNRFRLKEWEHIAIVHPHLYISLAVVDAKFICTSWVFVLDRRTGRSFEHSRKRPPDAVRLPGQLYDARFAFGAPGYEVFVHNRLEAGEHRVRLDIRARRDRPAVRAELTLTQDLERVEPLVAVLPLGRNKPLYTCKAPCPVHGWVRIGDEEFVWEPGRDLALLDVHKAYYPRRTFWRWATFAGRDAEGRLLAFNATHNVAPDDAVLNENVLWVDGRLHPLGAVRYDVPADPREPWRLRTVDGRADLTLTPQGLRSEDLNLIAARSRYVQPCGLFNGHLIDGDGRRHEVSDLFGVAEDHDVVW